MASVQENLSMAVFCDFENVALGVRDAHLEKFDIKPILERLLLKGSIVVKKAYCDWDRYKSFKATMHEANFELIEIPHVRQSGKNSADIRLVVDALDLCYTKAHVNTFVIISGDSDFSPLVSKLRENARQVIGVGVMQSTSDLLIANCDEFIFYNDLVRDLPRGETKSESRGGKSGGKRTSEEEMQRKAELEVRRTQAIEIAMQTFDALAAERGESGKIWASVLKEAIKRRKPDFAESCYGFRAFGNLLEEAQARGLLEFARDEKSNAYVYRASMPMPMAGVGDETEPLAVEATEAAAVVSEEGKNSRRRRRGGRRGGKKGGELPIGEAQPLAEAAAEPSVAAGEESANDEHAVAAAPSPRRRRRGKGIDAAGEAHAVAAAEPENAPAAVADAAPPKRRAGRRRSKAAEGEAMARERATAAE